MVAQVQRLTIDTQAPSTKDGGYVRQAGGGVVDEESQTFRFKRNKWIEQAKQGKVLGFGKTVPQADKSNMGEFSRDYQLYINK